MSLMVIVIYPNLLLQVLNVGILVKEDKLPQSGYCHALMAHHVYLTYMAPCLLKAYSRYWDAQYNLGGIV